MPISPTASNFNRHPLLLLAVYFATGIIFGANTSTPVAPAVIAILLLISAFIFRTAAHFLIPVSFIPLGIVCYQVQLISISDDRIRTIYSSGKIESGDPVEIEGTLAAFPETAVDGQYLRVRTERIRFANTDVQASGDVRLFLSTSEPYELRYGDRLRVMCRLMREEQFRNPGVRSRIATLDEQGIDATAVIKSPLLIENLGSDSVLVPVLWVYESRRWLITAFNEKFSASTSGVLIASLLGDKHFLDRDTADVFREGGTFHVLVISGLHITFIGGLTFWVVSLFTRRPLWRCVLPAAILWAYTLAVGGEIPVVRASTMFTMLLFGRFIDRSGSLLNSLGACVLLLLVWRPTDLFSASFQLTFASVTAIVGCAFPLVEKLRSIGTWTPTTTTPLPPNVRSRLRGFCETLYWNDLEWQKELGRQIWSAKLYKVPWLAVIGRTMLRSVAAYIFEGLLVSFIVQLWMLPLLVIYFHRVSPVSLFLNLWVGVFLAIESFAAVFAVAVGSISPWLAAPLVEITEFSNTTMLALPSFLAELGAAGFRLPAYAGMARAVYVLYAVAIIIATIRLFHWRPYSLANTSSGAWRRCVTGMIILSLCLVIVLHPFSATRPDGKLTVDFLDVGQGDSALVTFPTGETMLIDGGGQITFSDENESSFEPDRMRIGEAVVSEFLWEKGYSRIDFVLATHADADHIDGLLDVSRNFDIGTLLIGDSPGLETRLLDELLRAADENSVPVKLVRRGDALRIGKVWIQFLNPVARSRESDNDSSVVTRITYGDRSFLLTGDIERRAELDLVKHDLKSDVVKVAHHGSRTSSTREFVDRVQPQIAVISVGRRSRFGHPHREVVERWGGSGASVMTTGERGTITISTDGWALETASFVQPP